MEENILRPLHKTTATARGHAGRHRMFELRGPPAARGNGTAATLRSRLHDWRALAQSRAPPRRASKITANIMGAF